MVLQKRKADGTYETINDFSSKRQKTSADFNSTIYSASPAVPTPSSSSQPSQAKVTRARGKKKAEPKEKRLARFRGSCPNDISVRLDRYLSQAQRIYLIERSREGNALKEDFVVQGSTGNVYSVTIDNVPHCDCPDHQKGHHCKHLLFVLLKVLQIPQSSNYWYQKALLTSELAEIFAAAPPPPQLRGSFIANQAVVGAWRQATGRETGSTTETTSFGISLCTLGASPFTNPLLSEAPNPDDPRRVPGSEDDCPICYDKMNAAELDLKSLDKLLQWCHNCHNAVHQECWTQWKTTKQRQGQSLTCVYCRSDLSGSTSAVGGTSGVASRSDEGFVNLASVSGVSTTRDTSTYHQSPRRYGGYGYYGGRRY
ncbi:hypothetical protein BDP27DRAFT_1440792 [Rhodocollybia butyracea]|uniref:SWIM-type domain-containing protein n=1 Tax=Rhodocollybia butyracea TaxID=206335 RepID=A0A9P5Q581_9AGAR|nr:hypothetical protein BDP27DRAFT_1440792 [Rhodocollybia butyracea]